MEIMDQGCIIDIVGIIKATVQYKGHLALLDTPSTLLLC